MLANDNDGVVLDGDDAAVSNSNVSVGNSDNNKIQWRGNGAIHHANACAPACMIQTHAPLW